MTKTFAFGAAIFALSQPLSAETLVRDGMTYVYDVKQSGNATIITGRQVDNNQAFRLRVSGTRVTGTVGSSRVSFSTRDVQSAAKPLPELAAR